MSLQSIVNTAQSIEFNRTKLVAQTISRSGKLIVGSRNWTTPWRFTITPAAVYPFNATTRGILETIYDGDRYATHTIQLGISNAQHAWIAQYLGDQSKTNNVLNTPTIKTFNGVELILKNCSGLSGYIFKRGDLVQPTGHPYVYQIASDLQATGAAELTATTHRVRLGSAPAENTTIRVGPGCVFNVVVTKLPIYRLLPGQLVEFSDTFDLTEIIE